MRKKVTNDQILFYSINDDEKGIYKQGEIWSRYYDAQIREDYITDVLVFREHKFFVTAHNFGDIHLRKLNETKNVEFEIAASGKSAGQNQSSIHVFKGHSRRVTSLAPIASKNTYFVSASLDGKLRIWCIEKMIELYCFDICIDSPVTNNGMGDTI